MHASLVHIHMRAAEVGGATQWFCLKAMRSHAVPLLCFLCYAMLCSFFRANIEYTAAQGRARGMPTSSKACNLRCFLEVPDKRNRNTILAKIGRLNYRKYKTKVDFRLGPGRSTWRPNVDFRVVFTVVERCRSTLLRIAAKPLEANT